MCNLKVAKCPALPQVVCCFFFFGVWSELAVVNCPQGLPLQTHIYNSSSQQTNKHLLTLLHQGFSLFRKLLSFGRTFKVLMGSSCHHTLYINVQ